MTDGSGMRDFSRNLAIAGGVLLLSAASVAGPALGGQESDAPGPLTVSGFEQVAVWGGKTPMASGS
jgi:N-acyl-D-aspartate/D-glutamate deacylase